MLDMVSWACSLALEALRQEDPKSEVSLGCRVKLCVKTKVKVTATKTIQKS